jgi:hypothetical protein
VAHLGADVVGNSLEQSDPVQRTPQRGKPQPKGLKPPRITPTFAKATAGKQDFTDGKRRGKRKLNLNSRTHERITVKIKMRGPGGPRYESHVIPLCPSSFPIL